ncbi:MAG TPA: exodeoxyribonuclease III [Kofleriaceae bacterium]|nr:exodeoxyribonuclease III [Kofleriaceae bacterium]
MKVATWNVNGVRKRSSEIMHWIDREEPDVICLQETKASPEQVPEPLVSVAGYHVHWHGFKGYSGVAMLLRNARFGDAPAFIHPPFDLEHRIVVATVGDIVFGSVYVPNGGKDLAAKMTFLRELVAWAGMLEESGKHLVLCGDFNVARTDMDVHPVLRKPMIGQSSEERALIEAFFGYGLVDVGRHVDPDNDRLFTWWAPWRNMRQRNIGWRLDYIAASQALVDPTVVCKVHRDVGTSDHAPVIAQLRDTPLGPTTPVPAVPVTSPEP